MNKRLGSRTIKLENPVSISTASSVVGTKEGEGPLREYFDIITEDGLIGEDSWEKAESAMAKKSFENLIKKANKTPEDINYILSGDLLNQSMGTNFGIRDLQIPFFGLFGACSTMGEAMSLGSMLIDGGYANTVIAGASSHFCSAEKQFRFPLELGTQRPPTSTWTVSGSGSCILEKDGEGPYITHITTGKIVDMGIKDSNNMGAAMSPAAIDVLSAHFKDTGRDPNYYDLIATGDLGYIGHELVKKLMPDEGHTLGENYTDCGILIFDKEAQDTHSGGSGCGCSAVTFAGYFYDQLKKGKIKKLLFIPTGALMSQTSALQGESIPAIAHAVAIEI